MIKRTVALLSLLSAPLAAQSDTAKTLFTKRDAYIGAGFAALTVAMFPLDESLAKRLQDTAAQANHFLRYGSRDVQYVADPGAIIIGVSLYAIGRVAHMHDVADLGLHGTEAVILSGAMTAVLKDIAGRSRPYASADSNPRDFGFGRGLTKGSRYQSFPSGHTTVAFAAAAAFTSESRRWWPRATPVVATVMYGGATLVGLSRMYNNAHWGSDVALGAAIGTFTGLKVVRYTHTHPGGLLDRWFLKSSTEGRVVLGWTADF